MDLKTKKKISLFIISLLFLIIFAVSIYIYFQIERGHDFFFASFIPISAMLILPFYYIGKGRKDVRQKHVVLQILILMIGPIIYILIRTYKWLIYLPPLSAITDPATAFVWFWIDTAICFFMGCILVIGIYYTDDIVEFFKNR